MTANFVLSLYMLILQFIISLSNTAAIVGTAVVSGATVVAVRI